MEQTTRPYDTWPYPEKKEESITWVLTQQQWSKLHGQEKLKGAVYGAGAISKNWIWQQGVCGTWQHARRLDNPG